MAGVNKLSLSLIPTDLESFLFVSAQTIIALNVIYFFQKERLIAIINSTSLGALIGARASGYEFKIIDTSIIFIIAILLSAVSFSRIIKSLRKENS